MNKKIASILLLFCSTHLFAINPKVEDGMTGNFDFGMSYTKNIESTFQFNNVLFLKYKTGNSSFSIGNNMSFISKTGENELMNKGIQDLKYALNSKKLDINFTLNHMYDISISIKNRIGSGLGIAYNFTDEVDKKIGFGISALREKEIPLKGDYKIQNRMSGNFDLMFKLNKNVTIASKNLYQPNIQEIGDFRPILASSPAATPPRTSPTP